MCMAKSGAQVLVLERAQQFKDRVRGEFIAPWGVAEAKRLGVLELLRDECAHEVPWVDFYSGNVLTGHRPMVPTTPHQLPCLSFYHPAMQELLIDGAASAGGRTSGAEPLSRTSGREARMPGKLQATPTQRSTTAIPTRFIRRTFGTRSFFWQRGRRRTPVAHEHCL